MKFPKAGVLGLAIAALLVSVFSLSVRAVDTTYGPKVYHKQGGDELVVASGGTITIETGGALTAAAGVLTASDNLLVRASTNLGANDLVYLSSYNAADGAFIAALADADVAGGDAAYVTTAAITSGATGTVYRAATSTFTTTGATVGDPVYLTITGTTTNTMSLSAPTGADDRTQIIGRVTVVGNSSTGRVAVNLASLPVTVITGTQVRDASIADGDMVADTLTAASLATSAVATAEILNGTIIDEDVSASAAIARSKLAEDALQIYGISIEEIRSDAGASLTAAETAGTFDITVGTNTILANGEVTDNETEVSVAYFQFVLPPEYVAAGDVTIRLPAALIKTGAPTDNGSTLDIEVYEQSDAGAVGADINSTAAATFVALDTWYNKDFVITATGLVAGDVLNVKITSSVIDSEAGAGTIVLNLAPPKVLLDVKG